MKIVLVFASICFSLLSRAKEEYKAVNSIRRPPIHFTQGLFFDSPTTLIESTGLYGSSRIQRINATNGEPLLAYDLNASYFAEGCAAVGDKIYQLTWKERKCFVYSPNLTLAEVKEIMPDISEGWGMSSDAQYLYVSEGSSKVFVIDPGNWTIVRNFSVEHFNGTEVTNINALQYVDGYIYANVFMTNKIVKFDSRIGIVTKTYDLTDLVNVNQAAYYTSPGQMYRFNPYNDVLNGIAYNNQTGRFYITGKNWNYIFDVELF